MADELYIQLPPRTKQRIDDAFYSVLGGADSTEVNDSQKQIPFDLVSPALRRLDLPEDDEEILTVLRNAASGWKGSSVSEDVKMNGDGDYELGVSLEDWRSVCSVLLEDADDEEGDKVDMGVGGGGGIIREDEGVVKERRGRCQDYEGGGFIPEEDNDEEDAYNDEEDGDGGELSDEDFLPGPRTRRARTARNRSPDSTATTPSKARRKQRSKDTDSTKLSAKQEQAAFDTFALFFPGTGEEELKAKRIMIKDVQRVAGLLKEKIKAEETIDMLEMFSTSPDKSMSYDDFVRMLVVAGLI